MKNELRKKSENVYFIISGTQPNAADPVFQEYDEAKHYLEDQNKMNEINGVKCKLSIVTQFDLTNHYVLIKKLIEEYHSSKTKIREPMMVFYSQSKEYSIVTNDRLAVEDWLKKPFTSFGPVGQFEANFGEDRWNIFR